METGKDLTESIVESSEETFDTCCSPCTEAGKTREAKHFCVECGSHFCEDCLLDHNKFPLLRSHQILDNSGKERRNKKGSESTLPTERCAIHHGKLIDMFCGDHDEVCCAACIAIKHRACVNVDYLPDIAQGIQDSTELKDTLHSLKDVLARLEQERESSRVKLATLGQEKGNLIKEVDKFESELIQKIKELAKSATNQICSKHEELKKAIQSDLDTLDTVISTTTKAVQKGTSKNDAQLFVNIKTSKKSIKDCEAMLDDLSSGKTKKEFKFTLNVRLKDMLTTLGSVVAVDENVKEYNATFYGRFKVAPKSCEIIGACAMGNGTYLVSDYTNGQLKRLNENFTIKDQIAIGNHPYSLQRVGPKDVAIFYSDGRVQFVSIGDVMKLTTSFTAHNTVAGGPFDIHNDEIFILKNKQFCICKRSGDTSLRAYENKDISQYWEPRQTALSCDKSTIYVANYDKGLLALTRDGKTKWMFTDLELKQAWDVCVLPGDIILVSGLSSNNIFQVDQNGKKIGMLLEPSKNLNEPFALAFDRNTSRLLVGRSSNEIHVYTVSKIK